MKISRVIARTATAPLVRLGDWLNDKLLRARDEFTILAAEMDERSCRVRE